MAAPGPACFDAERNSWVLSRYRDVVDALREPRMVPASALSTVEAVPLDAAAHAEFRAQALRVLAPARWRQWEAQFAVTANERLRALPASRPVDLVLEFAKPWALEAACAAAGVPREDGERMGDLAHSVFLAAGEPFDGRLEAESRSATQELARFFQAAPLEMQMFIALAHSLPAFLGNAWMALAEHPVETAWLRSDPRLLPKAIDELLRLAGPARAQFRRTVAEVTIGGCTIPAQARVILRLDRANRDPEHFPDPDELRFNSRDGDHVAFGAGIHACVGSTLVRWAAAAATHALLDRFSLPQECTCIKIDSFALRYVKSLIVVLEPA